MGPEVLLVPGLVLLAGGGAYLAHVLERGHRRAYAALARSQGWAYAQEDGRLAHAFGGRPFGQGQRRRASDVLTGTFRGRALAAFTYSFQTSSTDSNGQRHTTTHRYGVIALRTPGFLPEVEVTPETVLTRVAGALGFSGVDLESEAFNDRYRVTAQDPRVAYDVLNPRTMQLLLDRPPVALRLLGADAVSWEGGRLDPAEVLMRLATVSDVLDAVPARVWADHGGSGA